MHYYLDQETALFILFIFSIIWIFFGWYLGRESKDLESYMLAGRKVGLAMGTATAMATWVTSNTTMVAPQLAYQMGVWGMLGYSLGSIGLLLFAFLARRIKHLMPKGYTSGDFFRLRFGLTSWRLFLLFSLIYSFGWLISLGMAGGILIEALSGVSYEIGMTVILTICLIYTLLGGLKAVIGTDFIQTLIIVLGILFLSYLVITDVGLDEIYHKTMERRPELLNLLYPAGIMFLFNNLFFGIGEIFHSNIWWSRAFAFRKDVGFKAYFLSGIFWAPIPIVAGFIAFASLELNIPIPQADQVGPIVASYLLGKIGAILIFIVVFSALASSLDSLLAATSDLILEDIYKKHINQNASDETLRKTSMIILILLGLVTWLFCLPRLSNLAQILHFSGPVVASMIFPIVFGLYSERIRSYGAIFSMLLGTITGLIVYFYIGFYLASLISAMISFLISLLDIYYAKKKNYKFSWELLNES